MYIVLNVCFKVENKIKTGYSVKKTEGNTDKGIKQVLRKKKNPEKWDHFTYGKNTILCLQEYFRLSSRAINPSENKVTSDH